MHSRLPLPGAFSSRDAAVGSRGCVPGLVAHWASSGHGQDVTRPAGLSPGRAGAAGGDSAQWSLVVGKATGHAWTSAQWLGQQRGKQVGCPLTISRRGHSLPPSPADGRTLPGSGCGCGLGPGGAALPLTASLLSPSPALVSVADPSPACPGSGAQSQARAGPSSSSARLPAWN